MKTTLNPFENAKRTAHGTGGGVSPAVIEEMQAEISILGSQNKTQTQDITDIKGSLNSINDNLSGFKFYPIGTNLVALISDDSFYKDANGKYVVWGTATANQLVEDNPGVYKSLASTEDCRGEVGADTCSPFRKLEAFNPSRNNKPYEVPTLRAYRGKYTINVFGYKKLYLMFSANVTIPSSIITSVTFYDKDAQSISTLSFSATANTWTNSFDIPKNAMYLVFDFDNTWDKYITWSLEP